jgi:catechol 2,3-dioxygenase-like lactoylglutathione lyase family enzyme
MAVPPIAGVLETAIYVADLTRSRRFYEDVLGLTPVFSDARLVAYGIGPAVLLVFLRGSTTETVELPGGIIPPHDGAGRIHYALSIAASDLPRWAAQLAAHGIAEEGRTRWPRGGTSLYFRDPDGHLGEFATPGIWPNEQV